MDKPLRRLGAGQGQLGRKQFANRVEAAGVTKSSRRSQGYFFVNVDLR